MIGGLARCKPEDEDGDGKEVKLFRFQIEGSTYLRLRVEESMYSVVVRSLEQNMKSGRTGHIDRDGRIST